MTQPAESSLWVSFDILAPDAASGAHVAMYLREELPGARIQSEPADERSGDQGLPHLLRCRAARPGSTGAETRAAIEAAIARLDTASRVAFAEARRSG